MGSNCYTNGPIKSLKQIHGCQTIIGSLLIYGQVEETSIPPIYEIKGCLRIKHTQLKSLGFLTSVTISCGKRSTLGFIHVLILTGYNEISDNLNLCLNKEEYNSLRTRLGSGKLNVAYAPQMCREFCKQPKS